MMNKVYYELKEWAKDGLISDFGSTDFQDDVFAEVLKVIRKKIQNESTTT